MYLVNISLITFAEALAATLLIEEEVGPVMVNPGLQPVHLYKNATQWWKEPLASFCAQIKHCLGHAGKREVLDDSGDVLCISGAKVTKISRYHSPSCWNIQLSLTSTIYELAVGSAGFWKVSEVWLLLNNNESISVGCNYYNDFPSSTLHVTQGLKLHRKVHPFVVDNCHAVHENQHLRPNPGSRCIACTKQKSISEVNSIQREESTWKQHC